MKTQNNIALKEWAVVLKALEEGKQTLLLRKGGIQEENGEFKPEHPEFFLYPTFEHESLQDIKSDWRPRLAAIEKENKDPKRVHFRLYAVADVIEKITDWEVCKRAIPFTVMSDEAIEKRFNYGDWPGVYMMMVRVYLLPVPLELPVKPAYAGCKSWVPLETSMFTSGSLPVIHDGAWPNTRDKIVKFLQSA
ncbi:MAG TPA: DUF1802 family protein [bacterium]